MHAVPAPRFDLVEVAVVCMVVGLFVGPIAHDRLGGFGRPFCSAQVHSGAMLSQASLNVEPVPREVLSSS